MLKIDVGCGNRPRKGYIGVDKYPKKRAEIQAEAHDLPFEDGEVDAINSSHMIEHIHNPMVEKVIQEFHRVLKVDGLLTLRCPDFERLLEMWIEGDYEYRWGIGHHKIFGWERYPGDFHYTGFSKERMRRLLTSNGFKIELIENRPAPAVKEREQFPDGDLFVKARKL